MTFKLDELSLLTTYNIKIINVIIIHQTTRQLVKEVSIPSACRYLLNVTYKLSRIVAFLYAVQMIKHVHRQFGRLVREGLFLNYCLQTAEKM